jgi:hypothetical protein
LQQHSMTAHLSELAAKPFARCPQWILLALLGSAACASHDPPEGDEPLRFETEHFRYYAPTDRLLCDQTGYWLERAYSAISEYLEVPLQRADKIDYFYGDASEAGHACGVERAGGCAIGDQRIFSETELKRHEIVHIVSNHRYGVAIPLLAEGLAEMLSCGSALSIPPFLDKYAFSPISLLELKQISGDGDPETSGLPRVAGRILVHYLVQRFGKHDFLRLYATLRDGDTTAATLRAQFKAVLGADLDQVLADWQEVPEREDAGCAYLLECQDPPVTGTIELLTRCGLGADAGVGLQYFPFDIGPSQRVRIDVDSDGLPPSIDPFNGFEVPRLMVGINSCNSGTFGLETRDAPFTQLISAPPGHYFVAIAAAPHTGGTLAITPLAPASDNCAAEEPVPLLPGRNLLVSRRGVPPSLCSGPWCPGARIDVLAMASGRLFPTPLDPAAGVPFTKSMFRCDEPCPADPTASCRVDPFVQAGVAGMHFNVLGTEVADQELLHLAVGPEDEEIGYVNYRLVSP